MKLHNIWLLLLPIWLFGQGLASHGSSLQFDGDNDYVDCGAVNHTFSKSSPHDQIHDLDYVFGKVWAVTRDGDDAGGYIIRYETDGTSTVKHFEIGDKRCMAAVGDLGYMWCAMLEVPSRIVRVHPTTLACTTYIMETGEDDATSICSDGERYLYMGLNTCPGKLIKFDTQDNSHITYTFDDTESEIYWNIFDGTYVWCAGKTGDGVLNTDGMLLKFDPSDGSHESWQIGVDDSHRRPHHLAYDGNYVWVSFGTNPGKYIKFDPVAETYDSFSLTAGNNNAYLIEYDPRGWLWLTTFGNGAGLDIMYKVDTADGSSTQYMKTIDKPHGICVDSSYNVWLSNYLYPTTGASIQKSLPTVETITVEAWIKLPPTATEQFYSIVQKYSDGHIMLLNTRKAQFGVHDGASLHSSPKSSTIPYNTWTYLAGVYDGDLVRLYLNSVEQGTATEFTGNRWRPFVDLEIAGRYSSWYADAIINQVRVYHRDLNASEILNNYNNPRQPQDTTSLIVWYKFNEFTGDALQDMSSYGNDGVRNGATWIIDTPLVSGRQ